MSGVVGIGLRARLKGGGSHKGIYDMEKMD